MKEENFELKIKICTPTELSAEDNSLIQAAQEACNGSYSPYSGFSVGVALCLSDKRIVQGSNQENAAYPSGMCAERTALYQTGAIYPDRAVTAMAIAAKSKKGFTPYPCPPCGACRQVMLETEQRHGGEPIRLILYGTKECYIIEGGAKALLPLQFDKRQFDGQE